MSTALLPAGVQEPAEDVLIVVEDRFLRKRVREQVEGMGLRAREAVSASRALTRVREARPTLILLDLWIDHGRRPGLLEDLRWRGSPPIPVLLLGEDPHQDGKLRAAAVGALGPVSLRGLGSIAAWIERTLAAAARAAQRCPEPRPRWNE